MSLKLVKRKSKPLFLFTICFIAYSVIAYYTSILINEKRLLPQNGLSTFNHEILVNVWSSLFTTSLQFYYIYQPQLEFLRLDSLQQHRNSTLRLLLRRFRLSQSRSDLTSRHSQINSSRFLRLRSSKHIFFPP